LPVLVWADNGAPEIFRARDDVSRLAFTIRIQSRTLRPPPEKIPCRRPVNRRTTKKVMGDKSPKANQKKSGQKDAKKNSANAKKNAAAAAKSAAGKKK
jgi:hypothetical protein